MKTSAKYFYLAIGPVATSWLALCWMCDSLWTRCAWRITLLCGANKQW